MKQSVIAMLAAALARAHDKGALATAAADITVEAPKDPAHGDLASNLAMTLARAERKSPTAIAQILLDHLEPSPDIEPPTIAGPGFINFKMRPAYWHREIRRAVALGPAFLRPQIGAGRRVQIEFLSANPTGPLTVGHGRNAVLGDTLARLFLATGHDVVREYYFNDGGRQMRLLGDSVRARYLQLLGRDAPLPGDGYEGEYIADIARDLLEKNGPTLADSPDSAPFLKAAVDAIFANIRATCDRLGISFDVFTNELDLMSDGRVAAVLDQLRQHNLTVERDGAVWLSGAALKLPNDQDQVLVRSTGEPTYRTPDIAYHIDKLARGFDLIIDVFGADHIAEHDGVIAALKALGYNTSAIHAIIYQFVTLTRGGEKLKMSTRKATYITLDQLLDEVGPDVVRFFFLFRKHDSHLDFDLDLAKRQAPENPVFYVQYAHARLASIFREAERANLLHPNGAVSAAHTADASGADAPCLPQASPRDKALKLVPAQPSPRGQRLNQVDLTLLSDEELALARKALNLPDVVAAAIAALEPHRIPFALLDLAGDFHRYYNQPRNRIIDADQPALSAARLLLADLLRSALSGGLELLGVSAPERM